MKDRQVVLACSALKQAYRDRLLARRAVAHGHTVFLKGDARPYRRPAFRPQRPLHAARPAAQPICRPWKPPQDAIVVDIARRTGGDLAADIGATAD